MWMKCQRWKFKVFLQHKTQVLRQRKSRAKYLTSLSTWGELSNILSSTVIGKCSMIYCQWTVTVRNSSAPLPLPSAFPTCSNQTCSRSHYHHSVALGSLLWSFRCPCIQKSHEINSFWPHYSISKGRPMQVYVGPHMPNTFLILVDCMYVNTAHSLLQETLFQMKHFFNIQIFI